MKGTTFVGRRWKRLRVWAVACNGETFWTHFEWESGETRIGCRKIIRGKRKTRVSENRFLKHSLPPVLQRTVVVVVCDRNTNVRRKRMGTNPNGFSNNKIYLARSGERTETRTRLVSGKMETEPGKESGGRTKIDDRGRVIGHVLPFWKFRNLPDRDRNTYGARPKGMETEPREIVMRWRETNGRARTEKGRARWRDLSVLRVTFGLSVAPVPKPISGGTDNGRLSTITSRNGSFRGNFHPSFDCRENSGRIALFSAMISVIKCKIPYILATQTNTFGITRWAHVWVFFFLNYPNENNVVLEAIWKKNDSIYTIVYTGRFITRTIWQRIPDFRKYILRTKRTVRLTNRAIITERIVFNNTLWLIFLFVLLD